MSRFKEHETIEKAKYEFPEYSKQELIELNNLLEEKYNCCRTTTDTLNWYIDQGGLSKSGAVLVTGWDYKINKTGEAYPVCDYPSKYLLLQDKLDKAQKLKGKKEYAIKKQAEEVSEQFSVINETTIVE